MGGRGGVKRELGGTFCFILVTLLFSKKKKSDGVGVLKGCVSVCVGVYVFQGISLPPKNSKKKKKEKWGIKQKESVVGSTNNIKKTNKNKQTQKKKQKKKKKKKKKKNKN